ncbi:F-box protein [Raphanus sativus]|uniref:F-box protein At1g11270-like n=1 Tax=Raphanus sativus TaxID=3726 RepID=A0A6J0K8U7_RAPSA|nr:F-box protein At1g11270-like [Raphanus sativus]KAJ4883550.1 F-box protein [Raphanus sativus]
MLLTQGAELLPDDLVELILEHVPVKPLLRFKSVSKKWKLTMDSPRFMERHLIRRKQLRGPDVLIFSISPEEEDIEQGRIFVLGSSIARTVWLPITGNMYCYGSCDGLVCTFSMCAPSVVANPATGWYHSLTLSNYQTYMRQGWTHFPIHWLGFGRDKIRGTFKPVWLYNSSGFEPRQDKAVVTYCEVFDFSTNAWRYVVPSSPYPISACHKPVHLDGTLYWFTECDESMVLSFDLHTETFQVIAPFPHPCPPYLRNICILDNRLCVSERKEFTQVIWSFDPSGKTWKTMCSLDLTPTSSWWLSYHAFLPIAVVDKGRLLLQSRDLKDPPVIYDLHTKSCDLIFQPNGRTRSVYYLESLFSALSN